MKNARRLKVICLPYAGGNRYSYNKIRVYFKESIELIILELPGRGKRISEPLMHNLDTIIRDLFGQISPHLDNGPYFLYGHSMGGILGHELIHYLLARQLRIPSFFLVTGCIAPQFREARKKLHRLTDLELKRALGKLGGFPKEILASKELMDYLLPVLKADITALEKFTYEDKGRYPVPVMAIAGDSEEISNVELESWGWETSADFQSTKFSGPHFFILDHFDKLAAIIKKRWQCMNCAGRCSRNTACQEPKTKPILTTTNH